MDMISLTVILLVVCTCLACAISAYKVVKYRDMHLGEWTEAA